MPRRLVVGTAAAVVFSLGYGAYRVAETDAMVAAADKIKVSIVQANMGIFAKRRDRQEGLRRHVEQSARLERTEQPDLLVWPESAFAYYIPDTRKDAGHVMGPLKTPMIFGGLAVRGEGDQRRVFNTAFMLDEKARITATVDKTYLLAFGEYLPFGERFPILYKWSPNSSRFSPGTHMRPMPFGDYRITTLVCYEDVLPAFVRKAMNVGDSHLLVNITNDAWFGDTTEPWIHLALAKLRAVEHRRFLVRATNSGVSAIIDPAGRVVEHSGTFERAEVTSQVAMLEGTTLYRTVGDWPGWLGLLVLAFALFRPGSSNRPEARVRATSLPQGEG